MKIFEDAFDIIKKKSFKYVLVKMLESGLGLVE